MSSSLAPDPDTTHAKGGGSPLDTSFATAAQPSAMSAASLSARIAHWRGFTFAYNDVERAGYLLPGRGDWLATGRLFNELYEHAPVGLVAYLLVTLVLAAVPGASLLLVAVIVLGEGAGGPKADAKWTFVALALAAVVAVGAGAHALFQRLTMDLGDELNAIFLPRLAEASLVKDIHPDDMAQRAPCVDRARDFGEFAPMMDFIEELVVRARGALALAFVCGTLVFVVLGADVQERMLLFTALSVYVAARVVVPYNHFDGAGFMFWANHPGYLRLAALHDIVFDAAYREVVIRHGAADLFVRDYANLCKALGSVPGQMILMASVGVPRGVWWDMLCACVIDQPIVIGVLAVHYILPIRWPNILLFVIYLKGTLHEVLQHCHEGGRVVIIMKEVRELYDLLDSAKGTVDETRVEDGSPTPPAPVGMGIALKDVTVEFRSGKVAVEGVSADISSGKVVLLTGIRGSGRSALLDALIGLVPVSSGDIILGGRPLAEHNTLELRRRVAYLSEDDTVLPLSLRENVLLGTSGGDDVALRALELAGLDLALDTVMGNARMLDESIAKDIGRGAREVHAANTPKRIMRPSAEVTQRVCGARAFARLLAGGARLVLVDGLRGKGIEEGALVKRILTHRAGATVIIVSDSPGNLGEQADQILCMDKGKIVQQGKHEDLLRDDGVYARLCGAQ